MKKVVATSLFLLVIGSLLSGCAAIDFLDGKYADPERRDDSYSYDKGSNTGYNGRSGSGHSH